MQNTHKLVRITTVPISLQKLIAGQMRFMSQHGFEVTMISSSSDYIKELEHAEKSAFEAVEMTRTITPFKDIVALYKLIKLLKQIKPTIVHTHTPKAGLIGMLAARILNIPLRLHTVAGLPLLESQGLRRRILELVEKVTYYCAHRIYPNSHGLKQIILDTKLANSSKLKVIGNGSSNGIDVSLYVRSKDVEDEARNLRSLYQIPSELFTFIFVGRLVKDKGIEELTQAFEILVAQNPSVRLVLVGPEEPELDPLSKDCLQAIRNNDAIIHVGYQNDVKPFLCMSSVLVFPSYREGFPNVPMQAGCFDLPSIVSDINGCNEIVQHGENGLIVPAKDSKALLKAMEQVYNDKELYGKMSKNARPMIVGRYDQRRVWDLILDEYRQLIKQNDL